MIHQHDVPAGWQAEFAGYLRSLSLRLGVAGALATVLLLPMVQWVEFRVVLTDTPDLAWANACWRLPSFLIAIAFLLMARLKPDGAWARPLLCLLSLSLMSHVVALALIHNVQPSPGAEVSINGLILVTLVLAPAAIHGLRDIVWIAGLPVAIGLAAVVLSGSDWQGGSLELVYPGMAVVLGAMISELLYRGHVRTFLAQRQLQEFAMTDPLTGLLNRRAMDRHLTVEMARKQRHGNGFAVVMMDLDHFKRVNDTYGHDVGDEILRRLAVRIREAVREEDALARWGGEEFLLMLHSSDSADAATVAEKIREAVAARPFRTSAGELPITISLGAAVHEGEESAEQTVARADEALYRAKAAGRNRVMVAES